MKGVSSRPCNPLCIHNLVSFVKAVLRVRLYFIVLVQPSFRRSTKAYREKSLKNYTESYNVAKLIAHKSVVFPLRKKLSYLYDYAAAKGQTKIGQ